MKKQFLLLLLAIAITVHAGVSNPDISLIGQVRSNWTSDPNAADQYNPTLGIDEVELVAQSAINPYADGAFVLAIGEEGLEVEEGYINLNRLFPLGFALKAGKFRAPLGKLNTVHPHAYPFMDSPHLLNPKSGLMPGEESYNDVALEISELLPGIGSWAPQYSFAIQQGSIFRTGQDLLDTEANYDPKVSETHLAFLAHVSNGFEIGENWIGDVGLSWARGNNNISANTQTSLYGTDLKLKLLIAPETRLILQGEGLWRQEEVATWNPTEGTYTHATEDRIGFVTIANFVFRRWNFGTLYEQLSEINSTSVVDKSVKAFSGFSLLEETTLFRVAIENRWMEQGDPVTTVSMQILYSMGPHKPHQF